MSNDTAIIATMVGVGIIIVLFIAFTQPKIPPVTTLPAPIINLSCPQVNISMSNTTNFDTTYTHSLRIKRESEQCRDTRLHELRIVSLEGSSMIPEIYGWYSLLIKDFDEGLPLVEGDVVIYEFGINKKSYAHSVFGVYVDTIVLCPLPDVFSDYKECHNVPYKNIKGVVCGVLYG